MQTGFTRRPAGATRTYNQLAPKFGAIYAPRPDLTLVASCRRGLRVPTEAKLFKQGSSVNTIDLQPINVGAWEGGGRGRSGRRLSFDLSAYHMRLTDDILRYRAPAGVERSDQ